MPPRTPESRYDVFRSLRRRDFVKTITGGLAAALPFSASRSIRAADDAGGKDARGQDYTVVYHVPDKGHFVHDPGMILLPGGKLLAAVPCWSRTTAHAAAGAESPFRLHVVWSTDRGATWQKINELPYADATPFLCEGKLYMFVQRVQHDGVSFVTSEDEGRSWSAPVKVLSGRYWNCQTAMVIKDRRLYWSMGEEFIKTCVIRCDLEKGLLNPEAWRASRMVEMPIPKEVVAGSFSTGGGALRCLEGNMIEVHGRLRVLARTCINHYATAHLAAVFDLDETEGKLELSFTQLSPLPGGQCKFAILYDEKSQLFWMASNLVANSQDLIDAGAQLGHLYGEKDWRSIREDRRFLTLSYSLDALNWFPAGWIAAAEKITQSFMYPSMDIDGDDLVVLSRTARDSGHYHDADLATFHRIPNFRAQAIDIRPRV